MAPQRAHGFTDSQWNAMSRALSYSRESRYKSVKEFVATLEDGTTAQLSGEVERQPGSAQASTSHRWIIAAVTGMALLAGITIMPGSVEPGADPAATPVVSVPEVTNRVIDAPTAAPEAEQDVPVTIDLPLSIDTQVAINTSAEPAADVPEVVEQPQAKPALPLNAIGFSADRAVVNESDPAVQIDVMRFNADDRSLSIRYTVENLSAIEGDDYFAPGSLLLSFGPRQRTARLLVPLVQDSVVEGDERFALQLVNTAAAPSVYGYQRILVTIRDDDPQAP